jgi:type II secretory pathway pseudopilin PulG
MKNQRGMTIIEALVVFLLISIILLVSVPLTLRLIRRYKCENEIRKVYAGLMEARQRAMQRNINYLVEADTDEVLIYEDSNNDGVGDTGERVDSISLASPVYFPLVGDIGGDALPAQGVANTRGLISPDINIRIDNDDSPYNCVFSNVTRIGMGKYDGAKCNLQ